MPWLRCTRCARSFELTHQLFMEAEEDLSKLTDSVLTGHILPTDPLYCLSTEKLSWFASFPFNLSASLKRRTRTLTWVGSTVALLSFALHFRGFPWLLPSGLTSFYCFHLRPQTYSWKCRILDQISQCFHSSLNKATWHPEDLCYCE